MVELTLEVILTCVSLPHAITHENRQPNCYQKSAFFEILYIIYLACFAHSAEGTQTNNVNIVLKYNYLTICNYIK